VSFPLAASKAKESKSIFIFNKILNIFLLSQLSSHFDSLITIVGDKSMWDAVLVG